MDKRAILAIALSMLVLIIYQRWVLKRQPRGREERKEIERVEPKPVRPEVSEKKAERDTYEGEARREERFVPEKAGEEGRIRDVTVETKLYSAVFSSYGGRLKSWKLRQYQNRVEKGEFIRSFEEMVNGVKRFFGFGGKLIPRGRPEPVDLVTTEALKDLPLAIEIEDERGSVNVGTMDFSNDSIQLGGGKREGTLLFRGSSVAGLEVFKGYRFSDDNYRVDMEVRVKNRGREPRNVKIALIWFGMMEKSRSRAFAGPVAMVGGQVKEIKEKKFKKEALSFPGDIQWFGSSVCGKNVPNKKPFFVSLVVPQQNGGAKLKIGKKAERVA
jgi:YidC/Oxa1 family membrane protein insertase